MNCEPTRRRVFKRYEITTQFKRLTDSYSVSEERDLNMPTLTDITEEDQEMIDHQQQPTVSQPQPTKKRQDEPPLGRKVFTVVSAFVVIFICVGLNYGMWPFINELRIFHHKYDKTQSVDPKWIVYINIIVLYVTGAVPPLASYLANTYKCLRCVTTKKLSPRVVMSVGVVLSTTGLVFSAFAKSVGLLCFTYGGVTGFGYGLILTPNLGILQDCFQSRPRKTQRHVFVNAIAFIGLSVGMLVFPPLFKHATNMYGRRSMFTIMACMDIQLLIPAMFLRSLVKFDYDGINFSEILKRVYSEDKRFLLVGIIFFVGVAHSNLIIHLPNVMASTETMATMNQTNTMTYDLRDTETLFIACAGAMIVGQLFHGVCSLRRLTPKFEKTFVLFTFLIVVILTTIPAIGSYFADSFKGYFFIFAPVGVLSGMYFPLAFVLIEQSTSSVGRTTSLGSILPLLGAGALVGLPCGDASSKYLGFPLLPAALSMGIVSCFMIYEAACEGRNSHGSGDLQGTDSPNSDTVPGTDNKQVVPLTLRGNDPNRPQQINIEHAHFHIGISPENKDSEGVVLELPSRVDGSSRMREIEGLSATCKF